MEENIYKKSKSGFKWTFMNTLVQGAMGFLILFFLSLFLGSERLGIVSILMVIYGFSETFVQFGISQSIIAREKNTNDELSSIFWLNFFIGVAVFLVINLIAGFIANFYGQPDLLFYIRVLSLVFLFEPLDLVFRAVLEKEIRFNVTSKIDILKYLVMGVLTAALVLLGLDVLGYVIAMVASVLVSVVMFSRFFIKEKIWFPRFHFKLSDVKKHVNFGFYVTARSFLNYVGFHIDELIIGKLLGVEVLGVYYLAKRFIGKTVQLLISSINKVTFPFFSKLKTDITKYKKAYLNLNHIFGSFGFPFFASIILLSSFIINNFFGDEWTGAIILIQIFSLNGIFQILSNGFAPPALYVFNKPKKVFFIDLFVTPLRIGIIFIAALFSIETVAVTLFLTVALKVFLLQYEVDKILGIRFKEFISNLRVPFFNTVLSILFYISFLFIFININIPYSEVFAYLFFGAFYIFLLIKLDKYSFSFFKSEALSILKINKYEKN